MKEIKEKETKQNQLHSSKAFGKNIFRTFLDGTEVGKTVCVIMYARKTSFKTIKDFIIH